MKVIAKPIHMIAWHKPDGKIKPIKFKIDNEKDKDIVVKVDKICSFEIEKTAGNIMYKYICQSVIQNIERKYELKYEIDKSKWILFKI